MPRSPSPSTTNPITNHQLQSLSPSLSPNTQQPGGDRKRLFETIFESIYHAACPTIVEAGFARSGISPLNSERVLSSSFVSQQAIIPDQVTPPRTKVRIENRVLTDAIGEFKRAEDEKKKKEEEKKQKREEREMKRQAKIAAEKEKKTKKEENKTKQEGKEPKQEGKKPKQEGKKVEKKRDEERMEEERNAERDLVQGALESDEKKKRKGDGGDGVKKEGKKKRKL